MRALVTGANGFLGSWLVRRLLGSGHAVRALVRPGSDAGALAGLPVEEVRGDVTARESLPARGPGLRPRLPPGRDPPRAAAGGFPAREPGGDPRRSSRPAPPTPPASPASCWPGRWRRPGPSATPRREEEPFAPREWYGESKAEAERLTLSFAGRLPVAVGRPPRIMGPGDRENLLFFRIARAGFLLAFGGPPRPLSWIDVEDCARGMELLATRPEAVGQAFFLASPERTSVEGLQREIARALGVRTRTIPRPGGGCSGAWARPRTC